jgi:hypothetical protein
VLQPEGEEVSYRRHGGAVVNEPEEGRAFTRASIHGEVAQERLPFLWVDRGSAAISVGKPEDDVGTQYTAANCIINVVTSVGGGRIVNEARVVVRASRMFNPLVERVGGRLDQSGCFWDRERRGQLQVIR